MPNVGTVVQMQDGQVAAVSNFGPKGDNDRVIFADGHEEITDAWKIHSLLTDETPVGRRPLTELHFYLMRNPYPHYRGTQPSGNAYILTPQDFRDYCEAFDGGRPVSFRVETVWPSEVD